MLEYDDMGDDEFVCEDGTTIPYDYVNDGMDDCSNGEDEFDDGGETGEGDDEDVWYVTSEMDFHFEGDLSDYKIELATCESDYDMDTGEEINHLYNGHVRCYRRCRRRF